MRKIDEMFKEFHNESQSLSKIKEDFQAKSKGLDERVSAISEESSKKDQAILELNKEIEKQKGHLKSEENKRREIQLEIFIDKSVEKWRKKTNKEVLICIGIFVAGLIYFFWSTGWDISAADEMYRSLQKNIIFSSIISLIGFVFSWYYLKQWYDKNHNHSNIENFKKGLKIPDDLKHL